MGSDGELRGADSETKREGRLGGTGEDAMVGEKQGREGEVFDYCLGLRILSRGRRGGA